MAETLEQLKDRRDATQAARDGAVTKFVYDGKEVTYRSLPDMDRIIADLDARIARADGSSTPRSPSFNSVKISYSKGT